MPETKDKLNKLVERLLKMTNGVDSLKTTVTAVAKVDEKEFKYHPGKKG